MAIVEVRCPRCGSPSSSKNRKKHEYQCDNCGATFVFVDTTKKEVVHDRRAHNCPICGRPIETGEGYVCTECGKEYLCENCVDEIKEYKTRLERIICKECLKEKGLMCDKCSNQYEHHCVVCGKQYCNKHAKLYMDLSIEIWQIEAIARHPHDARPFALYCPDCEGYVCHRCYVEKKSFLGSKPSYYCKKCGTKLKMELPLSRELFDRYY